MSDRPKLLTFAVVVASMAGAVWVAAAPAAATTSAYNVVASIPVPARSDAVAVNSATGTVYQGENSSAGTVAVVDEHTDTVTGTLPYLNIGSVLSLAVDSSTNRVVVGAVSAVAVVDAGTNTVDATIGLPDWPNAVAVDAVADTIYVALRNHTLEVINGRTYAVIKTIQLPDQPGQLAVDPTRNLAYITYFASTSVSVFDGHLNAIVRTITTPGAFGIDVDPATDTLYVASGQDRSLSVLDARSGAVKASVVVGSFPTFVAFDPVAHTVAVTNPGDGTTAVVDTATNSLTAVVATGQDPQAIVVDPTTDANFVVLPGVGLAVVARRTVVPPDTLTQVVATPADAVVTLPVTLTAHVANSDGGGALTFGTGIGSSFAPIPGCAGVALSPASSGSGASCTTTSLPVGFKTITAEYGGDAGSHPSTGSNYVNVEPIPTVLTASPVLLRLVPLTAYAFTLQVRLTALGVGLANAPVVVALSSAPLPTGSGSLCVLTTGADGTASCTVSDAADRLDLLLGGGYYAFYEGDLLHSGSVGSGPVLSVR